MPCSAQAAATPFSRGSVDHRLNSTSTAATLVCLTASWIVAAETSDSEMPPILPVSTYSLFRMPNVSDIGRLGSRLAHSNMSTFFRPFSWVRMLPTDLCSISGDESGLNLSMSKPPFMLRTTLSASSGYLAK